MIAAVLYETGRPLVIERDIEVPSLKRGQVLVKLAYSGVCHSQLMEVRGLRGEDRYLPHMLGHEGSGEVIDVGEGVTKVQKGDPVIVGWIKGDGIDAGGTEYRHNGKIINAGAVTTFSDCAIVSENRCVPVPAGIPLDVAVLFGCAVPTGAGIPINQANLDSTSSVAVIGLGGVGLSALMGVVLHKTAITIAVDLSQEKLDLALELGATHTIHPATENVEERIRVLTEGRGLDLCIEAAGSVATIEQAFGLVRRNGGKCIFASHPPHDHRISIDPFELICGKDIKGSWGGGCFPDRDVPIFADYYRGGNFPLERLLSRTYALNEINSALDDLADRKIARALVRMES